MTAFEELSHLFKVRGRSKYRHEKTDPS